MSAKNQDFTLEVEAVDGLCPAGERHAEAAMAAGHTPVFSCEGPCVRGDIARLAANHVGREAAGMARACQAEAFLVPQSAMARWVKSAEKSVVIDGCFLKCTGRVVNKLVGKDRVIHIDALPLHKKYSKIFSMDDVPEADRQATAREVADKIHEILGTPPQN